MDLVLGLDLSTSKIGIAILGGDAKIILSEVVRLDEGSLFEKTDYFMNFLTTRVKKEDVKKIVVEEPFLMTSQGGSAFTTAILLKFNAMCCYSVYKHYGLEPIMISPMSCRSKMGIKIPRGLKGRQKKQIIIDFIVSQFKDDFKYSLTSKGNYQPGTDDRADSLLLALYGQKI